MEVRKVDILREIMEIKGRLKVLEEEMEKISKFEQQFGKFSPEYEKYKIEGEKFNDGYGYKISTQLAVNKGICPFPTQCNLRSTCTKDHCHFDECSNGFAFRRS